MLTHILLWRFHDDIRAHGREKALQKIAASVETLKAIPNVADAGTVPLLPGGEWDFLFYVRLPDIGCLDAYQNHPLHLAHKDRCKTMLVARTAFDVEGSPQI